MKYLPNIRTLGNFFMGCIVLNCMFFVVDLIIKYSIINEIIFKRNIITPVNFI